MDIKKSENTNKYFLYLIIWLALAFLAGYSGKLQNAKPPMPQVLLLTIVALLVISSLKIKSFRNWICSIPTPWLIAVHLTRFVGFYFLILYQQGRLPFDFAVYGGWGDIAVAVGALVLLVLFFLIKDAPKVLINFWNIIGLIDILFLVIIYRLNFSKSDSQ